MGDKVISAILSHPDSFDYPIYRKNLPLLLKEVDEVIVCFTQHGNHPLRDWLRTNMPGVTFLDVENSNYPGDWRNKSTNYALDNAKGDWILSLEQDFFIKDYPHFFNTVKEATKKYEVITFHENQRFHPAFVLVKRDKLNGTGRDFSVMGQDKDHFWLVSKQLKGMCTYTDLDHIGLKYMDDWFHMAGLTENYFAPKPYYRMDEFHAYNDACLALDLPISDYWRGEMERCKDVDRPEKLSLHIGKFL